MALVRCRNRKGLAPWSALDEFENEFNRLFDIGHPRKNVWNPAIDLSETEDGYLIEADLPGLNKDDIELTIEDNVVTLKGERKQTQKVEGRGYYCYERRHGNFQRSFKLPAGVDAKKVLANFEDGVLHVEIPKLEEAKPKRIEVKVK